MHTLVTGAAGFIGSNLTSSLLKDKNQVIAIDNLVSGKIENLEQHLSNNNLSFHPIDIQSIDSNLLKNTDIIFHNAASKMTVCLDDPELDLNVNALGTLKLLKTARKSNIRKFIHASTGSVYGNCKEFPTKETTKFNPVSYYGISKLAGEQYVRLFFKLHSLPSTILRYYHVYGPNQNFSDKGGVISIFIKKALKKEPLTIFGSGKQIRSFTFVDDIVKINKLAIKKGKNGEAYNCASGMRISLLEVIDIIREKIGKITIEFEPERPGDIFYFEVDNSKLKRDFRFENFTSFDIGIEKTIDWMENKLSNTQ